MPARRASARRYAQAIFQIARAQQQFDRWQHDLASLAEAAKNADLVALVESPRLSTQQKRAALREAFPILSDQAVNLATVLFTKGRFAALAEPIALEFQRMVDTDRGIVRAEVITAVELDQARKTQIAQTLSAVTGQHVQISYRVNPAIVAGMVVRLGDRVLDGSVTTRLEGLRRTLQAAGG